MRELAGWTPLGKLEPSTVSAVKAFMIFILKSVTAGLLSMLQMGLDLAVIQQKKVDTGTRVESSSAEGKTCLKYLLLSSARTFNKQGESIGLHSYSVSDGAKVYASYFYYRSSQRAVREMNRRLASAREIISRETLLDEKGQKSGVKVVGRFKSRTVGREFKVLWTDGSDLKIISGPSEAHVLQLLKQDCNF